MVRKTRNRPGSEAAAQTTTGMDLEQARPLFGAGKQHVKQNVKQAAKEFGFGFDFGIWHLAFGIWHLA